MHEPEHDGKNSARSSPCSEIHDIWDMGSLTFDKQRLKRRWKGIRAVGRKLRTDEKFFGVGIKLEVKRKTGSTQ
jgi:hypothetical protein